MLCIFNLDFVTSQSLENGGTHDSQFEYIFSPVTFLF